MTTKNKEETKALIEVFNKVTGANNIGWKATAESLAADYENLTAEIRVIREEQKAQQDENELLKSVLREAMLMIGEMGGTKKVGYSDAIEMMKKISGVINK